VAIGVPDNRPHRLPGLVRSLLEDDEAMVDLPDGIDPVLRERLLDAMGDYAELCGALTAGPVPMSLQHDDLHDANVFVVGNGHRFFDWGDASVGHPFQSLMVPLRMATSALDLPQGSPVMLRLRDAYLQPWRPFAVTRVLHELVDLALQVTPLERSLTWWRILRGIHPEERADWLASVPGWAAETAEPGPLAGVPEA
jgi:Ser/Thr protein kinase RdoA (MazF antagonist)